VTFPDQYARYIILHGSIAIDGISLTVAAVGKGDCTVSIIPHTLEKTTLSRSQAGMRVNMEFDVLGKYVESLLAGEKPGSPVSVLSREKMREWGYDL
jgi:riboflavin synthase